MQAAVSKIGSRHECFEQTLQPLHPEDGDRTGWEMPARKVLGAKAPGGAPLVTLLEESMR